MNPSLYDETLRRLIAAAADRLRATLERETPTLAARTLPWIERLSKTGRIEDYFTHPRRFPMLLLPWWAAGRVGSRSELAFHGEVVYSTVAAYYYVRLIDDLVDQRGDPGLDVLPVAAVLHTECLCPYLAYFPAESAFWTVYRTRWLAATDAAAGPLAPGGDPEGLNRFALRAAQRLGPATIPLAAVALHAGRSDLVAPWTEFMVIFARVEQLLDDLTDWRSDQERGLENVLLAEGRRRQGNEPIEEWVVREGLLWALDLARQWLEPARQEAAALWGEETGEFFAVRAAMIDELRRTLVPALDQLRALECLFDPPAA